MGIMQISIAYMRKDPERRTSVPTRERGMMSRNHGDDWDPHFGIFGLAAIAVMTFTMMLILIAIIRGGAFHEAFTSPRILTVCAVVSVMGVCLFHWTDRTR